MVASRLKFIFFLSVLCLSRSVLSFGKFKAKFIYNFFKQNGENGFSIPTGNKGQKIQVTEPVIVISQQINENTDIGIEAGYDTWTSASDKEFDTFTSASFSEDQKRKEYGFSINLKDDKDRKGLNLSLTKSDEWDYHSKGISIAVNHKFAEDNANITFSTSLYEDHTSTYDYLLETTHENRNKDTYIYQVGISQFLTKESLISFSFGHSKQNGALESALNSIDLNGIRIQDSLPSARVKNWLASTYIYSLTEESSVHLTGVIFKDSWEMKSQSFEVNYFRECFESYGLINFYYRFYLQNQYDFFQESFKAPKAFMTSDSDYQKFHSHNFGMYYSHEIDLNKQTYSLTFGLGHYIRSNNLYFSTLQTSFELTY